MVRLSAPDASREPDSALVQSTDPPYNHLWPCALPWLSAVPERVKHQARVADQRIRKQVPRLSFKPDSSFFRKIALGAVGTRAVQRDLNQHGHETVELERGSTDTKLWKDVKRKRVRVPDLVCQACGVRVESRAKTRPDLAMSHSPTDEARAWDFGMVDEDWIAFPVCQPADETYWSAGQLTRANSYWHERN